MEYGLQVFDEKGNCVLDIATASTKLVGFGNTGKTDGSLTDPRLIGKRFWVRVVSSDIASAWRPIFSINEVTGTINWSFLIQNGVDGAEVADCKFIYGVY